MRVLGGRGRERHRWRDALCGGSNGDTPGGRDKAWRTLTSQDTSNIPYTVTQMHAHTHKAECTLSPALHITALSPFFFLCRELKYFTSSKSILVHWSVCMPCSKPWETIHHANQAVSQVKMNWLWVRAMRGRAYGSDEAENWPQKKNESEGERKGNHKGGQKKVKRKKEREKGRKGVWELGIKAASKNAGRGWALLQLNSEWYINTGLVLGCPS